MFFVVVAVVTVVVNDPCRIEIVGITTDEIHQVVAVVTRHAASWCFPKVFFAVNTHSKGRESGNKIILYPCADEVIQ